jgi:hypothetical protein
MAKRWTKGVNTQHEESNSRDERLSNGGLGLDSRKDTQQISSEKFV